jgi:hypothetical protein
MSAHAITSADRKPLTADQVWNSDEIMAWNGTAEIGLSMDAIMGIVRAVESVHGIKDSDTQWVAET